MDPLRSLIALERFGIEPELDTIRRLTGALDDPQFSYRTLIVAGTNGKGSVVAMVDAALRAAGYRVGRYTSPHLQSVTERFVIDGVPITESALRREAADLLGLVDRLVSEGRLSRPATFFEVTTAIALSWFRRNRIDLALLEVGLGGRFDATNVATPIAGVITSIGLEHRQYLGDTLEEIAWEKAGIIKPDMQVTTSESRPELLALFDTICRQRGAHLIAAARDTQVTVHRMTRGNYIQITTPRHAYPRFRLGLAGAHQISNAIGAVRLLESLGDAGMPVSPDAIVSGLSHVVWPGRLDLVKTGEDETLFDAAHNPAAACTLAAYLHDVFPGGLPIVLGVMDDKDVDGIVSALLPHATRIVCTAPATPRAIPPAELAARVRRLAGPMPVTDIVHPGDALAAARREAGTVCVTGSIFLVGELLSASRRTVRQGR